MLLLILYQHSYWRHTTFRIVCSAKLCFKSNLCVLCSSAQCKQIDFDDFSLLIHYASRMNEQQQLLLCQLPLLHFIEFLFEFFPNECSSFCFRQIFPGSKCNLKANRGKETKTLFIDKLIQCHANLFY